MSSFLTAVLQESCRKLDLPPWVAEGRASGSLSMLMGMACVEPDFIPAEWLLEGINPYKAYSIRPRRSLNPVGFILSHHPLQSPDQTFEFATQIGLKEALALSGAFRPSFQNFISEQVNHARLLLRNQRGEITGTHEIRPAVLQYFRELWRLLEAPQLSGETLVERTQSARRQVELKYREEAKARGRERKTPVFVVDPGQSRVRKRGNLTLWNRLTNLGKTQEIREKKARRLTSKQGADHEEFQDVVYDLTGAQKGARWLGKGLEAQASNYPCALGIPRDLGRAELWQIITTVSRLQTDEDVVLASCIFGLCRHEDVRYGQLRLLEQDVPLLRTKVKVPHYSPRAGKALYRPRSSWLVRPLPKNLAKRLQYLRKAWKKRFLPAWENAGARLNQICPTATHAKLLHACVVHGESWFGLPWSLVESAFNSQRSKFPAPRSYTHISPRVIRKSEPFLKLVDPTFAMPAEDWWEGTGSALVPTTTVVRQLVTVWREYLVPAPVMEIEEMIPRWNAAAAGMHMTVLLLCGLRNHPLDGISLDFLRARDWGLVKQKGEPFAFYLSPILRQLLKLLRERWNEVKTELERANITLRNDLSGIYVYGFLRCDLSCAGIGQLSYTTPDHLQVVEAFLSQPSLKPFARLDRKWTRHFSNTILREAGFSENLVRTFHGHADYMLHSFRRHRLESLISKNVLEPLVDCLAHEIGFIP